MNTKTEKFAEFVAPLLLNQRRVQSVERGKTTTGSELIRVVTLAPKTEGGETETFHITITRARKP